MPVEDKNVTDTIKDLKAAEIDEPIARFLGMKLEKLEPGYAKITMKLRQEHQNFNKYVFGGIVMAIADQAFAYGSNSLAYPSVATQFNTNFINAPEPEDTLTAECKVLRSGKRAGVSEITVTNQDDKMIAKATGVTIRV